MRRYGFKQLLKQGCCAKKKKKKKKKNSHNSREPLHMHHTKCITNGTKQNSKVHNNFPSQNLVCSNITYRTCKPPSLNLPTLFFCSSIYLSLRAIWSNSAWVEDRWRWAGATQWTRMGCHRLTTKFGASWAREQSHSALTQHGKCSWCPRTRQTKTRFLAWHCRLTKMGPPGWSSMVTGATSRQTRSELLTYRNIMDKICCDRIMARRERSPYTKTDVVCAQ